MNRRADWFAAITELSPDIISIIGKDGALLYNSPASYRIHGYTADDLLGRNTLDLIHPEDQETVGTALREVTLDPGAFATVQYRYLNKDGSYIWMEATAFNQLHNPQVQGVVTISRDISERKKIEGQLGEALATRDEFLSICSHEFKTPLTVIRGQLELLVSQLQDEKRPVPPREQLIASLESAGRQVDRLAGLVADLLDVTRIKAGRLHIEMTEFDLSATVMEAASQFALPLSKARCDLELNIAPGVIGRGDQNRIAQVIENLLSNAIKYAPGKPIAVSLSQDDKWMCLAIRDEGEGIPAELHEQIFQRFERATASRAISGLGLGLYISKQIIAAHQGRLGLHSEVGKGATFFMELPR